MNAFLGKIFPHLPPEIHAEIDKEIRKIIQRNKRDLLGEVQSMLGSYSSSRAADLDLLRREVDRIFLEDPEP